MQINSHNPKTTYLKISFGSIPTNANAEKHIAEAKKGANKREPKNINTFSTLLAFGEKTIFIVLKVYVRHKCRKINLIFSIPNKASYVNGSKIYSNLQHVHNCVR